MKPKCPSHEPPHYCRPEGEYRTLKGEYRTLKTGNSLISVPTSPGRVSKRTERYGPHLESGIFTPQSVSLFRIWRVGNNGPSLRLCL